MKPGLTSPGWGIMRENWPLQFDTVMVMPGLVPFTPPA
jgi:hypothetical protein